MARFEWQGYKGGIRQFIALGAHPFKSWNGSGAGSGDPLFPDPARRIALAGWFHPLRRSGIMETRRLFGFEARDLMMMVAGEGLDPP